MLRTLLLLIALLIVIAIALVATGIINLNRNSRRLGLDRDPGRRGRHHDHQRPGAGGQDRDPPGRGAERQRVDERPGQRANSRPSRFPSRCASRSTRPRAAAAAGEVPVGAVVTRDGAVLARRPQPDARPQRSDRPCRDRRSARRGRERSATCRLDGCDLWVTLEPCAMCAGAIALARIAPALFRRARPQGRRRAARPAPVRPADLPPRARSLSRHRRGARRGRCCAPSSGNGA